MTKEVEDIIRNKAYYELTSGERESVGEYAQNEEEYNNMQWFLTGSTAAFGGAKIEPSAGLRKGVMEHLTEGKKKKGFWLNSVGVFMLPTNKKFYQKPAFQLGAAALVVVGLLFVLNPGVDDENLAYTDPVIDTPIELNETNPSQELELNEPTKDLLNDQNLNEQQIEQEFPDESEDLDLRDNSNERFLELAPPAPELESTQSFDVESGNFYAAPTVEEVEMVDDEEEVEMDYELADDVVMNVDELNKDEVAEVVVEKTESTADRKADKGKNGVLRSISMKKDIQQESKLVDMEPSVAVADDMKNVPASASSSGYTSNGEWIKPKSLHINKTKELNALFFVEK